jgi:hypothetical protein
MQESPARREYQRGRHCGRASTKILPHRLATENRWAAEFDSGSSYYYQSMGREGHPLTLRYYSTSTTINCLHDTHSLTLTSIFLSPCLLPLVLGLGIERINTLSIITWTILTEFIATLNTAISSIISTPFCVIFWLTHTIPNEQV